MRGHRSGIVNAWVNLVPACCGLTGGMDYGAILLKNMAFSALSHGRIFLHVN